MNKSQLTVTAAIAAGLLFVCITDSQYKGMTVEQIKAKVTDETKAAYLKSEGVAIDPNNQIEWRKVARMAVKQCADLHPNCAANWETFCNQNPEITNWLHTICGETIVNYKTYNYFEFNVMLAINNGIVLKSTTGSQWNKKETVDYLTTKTKEFFVSTTITPAPISDDMLEYVVAMTMFNIKTATPEILKNYTGSSDWKSTKSTVDTCLMTYYANTQTWPINNPDYVNSYSKEEELANA
ncbi:MAG: hypothetical protein ACD_80C00142G0006 [uncultured bacterium (gcode 4)]|uniref:Uncharacterized protein n=1 Tax=uncultured bacterium (gcode 4) TaxID=1234023 RepID=K1YHX2_9BACT|nr:MAG: hypothetical protein ACD_80C00142G0006 [uncultured bacterium (gcode 4)]HBB04759.1 hypothetical protein [Candidatus Gracilibacteria bacterium]